MTYTPQELLELSEDFEQDDYDHARFTPWHDTIRRWVRENPESHVHHLADGLHEDQPEVHDTLGHLLAVGPAEYPGTIPAFVEWLSEHGQTEPDQIEAEVVDPLDIGPAPIPPIFTEAAEYGRMGVPVATRPDGRSSHDVRMEMAQYIHGHIPEWREALTEYAAQAGRSDLREVLDPSSVNYAGILWLADFAHWYIEQHPPVTTTPPTEGAPMTDEIDLFVARYTNLANARLDPRGTNHAYGNPDQDVTAAFIALPTEVKVTWRDLYNQAVATNRFTFASVRDFDADAVATNTYGYSTQNFFILMAQEGVVPSVSGNPIVPVGHPGLPTPAVDAVPSGDSRFTIEHLLGLTGEQRLTYLPDFRRYLPFDPHRPQWAGELDARYILRDLHVTFRGMTGGEDAVLTRFVVAVQTGAFMLTVPLVGLPEEGPAPAVVASTTFPLDVTPEVLWEQRTTLLPLVLDLWNEWATANGRGGTWSRWMPTNADIGDAPFWRTRVATFVREPYLPSFLDWLRREENRSRIPNLEATITDTTAPTVGEYTIADITSDFIDAHLEDFHTYLRTGNWRVDGYVERSIRAHESGGAQYPLGENTIKPGFVTWLNANRPRTATADPSGDAATTPAPSAEPVVVPIGPEHPEWQAFAQRMADVASANSMCPEYDRIARLMDLPTRKTHILTRITLEVPVTIDRGNNVDDRTLREAARALLEQSGSVNRSNRTEVSRTETVG